MRDLFRIAWDGGQHFVAYAQRAGVDGVLVEEVVGQIDSGWIVHGQKLVRHDSGIMGGHEGDVGEEGLVIGPAVEEIDGGVDEQLGRMLARGDMVAAALFNFL